MFSIVRQFRATRLRTPVQQEREFYAQTLNLDQIRVWQLQRFNEQWTEIGNRVPQYARLPKQFSSWKEFQDAVPITDRKSLQDRPELYCDPAHAPDFTRVTGGSTAEPVRLPAWNSELDQANRDLWLARSWFRISPADKLFLIWGHSHLLGSGIRGKLNGLRRAAKDTLLGYYRQSAYDLSPRALRRAGDELLRFRPAYVVAYSVALDLLARANEDRAEKFARLGLKAAIATAEAFPKSDSSARVTRVLGCPVAMEYGAVETGPIAHQRPDGEFAIFWRHWFVEGIRSDQRDGAFDILLTSLYPRCTPLIRYRIGDLISEDPNDSNFRRTFKRVIGRCNDFVELPGGTRVHSEAFTHAIKDCRGVLCYQVVQSAAGEIRFCYTCGDSSSEAEQDEIRFRLQKINPELSHIRLERVESLQQSRAGKTRFVLRESQP